VRAALAPQLTQLTQPSPPAHSNKLLSEPESGNLFHHTSYQIRRFQPDCVTLTSCLTAEIHGMHCSKTHHVLVHTVQARMGLHPEEAGCYTVHRQLRCNEPQASEGVQQGRQGAVHQPQLKKAEGNERAPAQSRCTTRTTECKAANGTAARRYTGRLEGLSWTGLVASPRKKGQQRPLQCCSKGKKGWQV